MSEKRTVFKGKIKQAGNFNFKDLYSFIYDFIMEDGYKVFEASYLERVTGDSKYLEIRWVLTKDLTGYFQSVINMDWQIIGLKDVEIEKDGKKVKTNNATIEIKFKGTLVIDYKDQFNTDFTKYLRKIFDNFVNRQRIDTFEGTVIGDVNDFINQCKGFLAIGVR